MYTHQYKKFLTSWDMGLLWSFCHVEGKVPSTRVPSLMPRSFWTWPVLLRNVDHSELMLFYLMILKLLGAKEWYLTLVQQLHRTYYLQICIWIIKFWLLPGILSPWPCLNKLCWWHTSLRVVFFNMHLWLYSSHCTTALEAFVPGFCPEKSVTGL